VVPGRGPLAGHQQGDPHPLEHVCEIADAMMDALDDLALQPDPDWNQVSRPVDPPAFSLLNGGAGLCGRL
jgi:hypothetical protein